jgi:hypothetical protein
MAPSTEQLIVQLSADLQPVKRLRPPLPRALAWLAVILGLGTAAILAFSSPTVFSQRTVDDRELLELAGTLSTGILGIVAAFYLSLPDRSPLWVVLPWPSFGVWLASSGYGCYQQWASGEGAIGGGAHGWEVGESIHCLGFILAVSLPMAFFLYRVLGQARPLSPIPVAFTGSLGVAGLAAFLLQFFHPFDVTVIDLALHLLAVILVIASGSMLARPALAGGR